VSVPAEANVENLLKMRLVLLAKLACIMFFCVLAAGSVGTFFSTPIDVDAARQSANELDAFHREHPVVTPEELDHFYKGLEAKYGNEPGETNFAGMTRNAILWRPWLAFLGVAGCLVAMRPSALYAIGGGAITSAFAFGLFGSFPALCVAGAVLIYAVFHRSFRVAWNRRDST